jgi:hypothetical protein
MRRHGFFSEAGLLELTFVEAGNQHEPNRAVEHIQRRWSEDGST